MNRKIRWFLLAASILGTAIAGAAVPNITVQPANQTNVVGTDAVFGVLASSSSPITYQWTFNGTNISNATNSVLLLADVQLDATREAAKTQSQVRPARRQVGIE